jgi:hypothetical protein
MDPRTLRRLSEIQHDRISDLNRQARERHLQRRQERKTVQVPVEPMAQLVFGGAR